MNNKFGECCNCPALVDGRYFTEYRDRDVLQYALMQKNNLKNSNEFRKFLIENGAKVINDNIKNIETNYKCNYNKSSESKLMPMDNSGFINGDLDLQ